VWFIFDNHLILPEYLVEFEYSSEEFANGSFSLEAGLEALSRPVNAFLAEKFLEEVKTSEGNLINIPQRVIGLKPEEDNIEHFCRGENKEYLNLLDCKVSELDMINRMLNIEVLVLACNLIENIKPIGALEKLKTADLSFNLIRKIEGIEGLGLVEELNLHNNRINSLAEIKKAPKVLKKITCFHNGIYLDCRYDEVILSLLPNLIILDWRNISKSLKKVAEPVISKELIKNSVFFPMLDPTLHDFLYRLESLQITNAFLLSMSGIEECCSLKRLNLSFNIITEITSLEFCEDLEELNLSYNFIEEILGLISCAKIKTLELSNNKISKLSNICHLSSLVRLCIESNNISRLDEVKDISSLAELYVSNNSISELKEILLLKHLPNIIVLDCIGNPFIDPSRSRSQILFALPALKVLNSLNVDLAELELARQELAGALSDELLERKCMGLRTTELRQLDLSSSKLRNCENMFTNELFPRLLELNLSANCFNSLSVFSFMPMLAKLDISNNKIDSFLCGNKGFVALPNLEILNFAYNILSSFNGLQQAQLKNLRILNVSHNQIKQIEYIECLNSLRELDISYNKLRSIERKLGVPNIRSVNLENNGIKNLHFLENLMWIQAIKASNNRISEVADVDRIQTLPNLLELMLIPNPIERKAGYRLSIIRKASHLLFLDGKEVTEEEKGDSFDSRKITPINGVNKLASKIASITLDNYFLKVHPRTASSISRKN
jgi:internalin A